MMAADRFVGSWPADEVAVAASTDEEVGVGVERAVAAVTLGVDSA